uniref:GM06086p n=1 Tax=Drosophila melanogaster TaxID=7227 RepID=Q95S84_DROME|nr:GM06086p [Drosophila melanogaster]
MCDSHLSKCVCVNQYFFDFDFNSKYFIFLFPHPHDKMCIENPWFWLPNAQKINRLTARQPTLETYPQMRRSTNWLNRLF